MVMLPSWWASWRRGRRHRRAIGKPMSMSAHEHATVTIITRAPTRAHAAADILAAVGRPGLVTPEMVKPGATVIDVGVNRTEAGLVGDVDPAVFEVAGLMTPVPGGVGPMTIAMLLRNTLTAAQHRRAEVAFSGS
jgi:methylenetetrahydrofolate dehydrogenase (NADP+)/methenyltetrahydrofolate cyclohydrolase